MFIPFSVSIGTEVLTDAQGHTINLLKKTF